MIGCYPSGGPVICLSLLVTLPHKSNKTATNILMARVDPGLFENRSAVFLGLIHKIHHAKISFLTPRLLDYRSRCLTLSVVPRNISRGPSPPHPLPSKNQTYLLVFMINSSLVKLSKTEDPSPPFLTCIQTYYGRPSITSLPTKKLVKGERRVTLLKSGK